ncbi:peptidoglycan D,D-transpeptidase FtsI family protein [Sediminibacillus albus]|uniref:serine-type D-Ala-D-Ala carboxypeptidase n=1 Tax=Sediminibacillus albus TaxID=407036 RepID=A0A1G9CSC1_9BACI|nr:penicillin-binding protein 2 [Sediminibacillus albus]SDK54532.1 Cell division protein FtsI/penicillin-binding protein 2 [Sediminibacillus albus]
MGKKKKKRAQLPFRLNILFLFVFLLFSGLILQLGVVQILNGEEAQDKINRTENTVSDIPVPRGKMYDRFGRLVLDNEPVRSITYTPPKRGASAEERLDLAEKLAEFIDIEDAEDEVRERDKKEYWYLLNQKESEDKLSAEEAEDMDVSEQYQAMLDRITDEELAEIEWDDSLLEVIAIKKELDAASELSPHIVKNENVTEEEYAQVSEHLNELTGIDATIDWNRISAVEGTFQDIIGNISTSERGIPSENLEYYLSRGYSRNDRVGTSGLEEQYESVLKGRKEQVEYITDSAGKIVSSEVVTEGQRGNDLMLSIDMELQQAVDKIAREELKTAIEMHPAKNKYMSDALVVMMNPQTGEVLAMSGQHYDRENDEYHNQSYRTLYDAHRPGSAVKGASVLAGLDSGVISPGTVINDTKIKIKDLEKSSYSSSIGHVDEVEALEKSSNVYMFHIAMRLGGEFNYHYGMNSITFNPESFTTMRNYFKQFGLGVETGIDYPYESTGYVGKEPQPGNLMDYAIGQYDTFTTMQLAQYVSTIANDGYRIRPRLVNEVRQPKAKKGELGPVIESFNTDVLNKIVMNEQYLDRVHKGFRKVFTQGTAANHGWAQYSEKYKVAGKTGTAENEVYKDGKKLADTENLSLVGYAPYDDPEVAFAIIVPNNGISNSQYDINHKIGTRIIGKYFELKEERDKEGVNSELSQSEEGEQEAEDKDE